MHGVRRELLEAQGKAVGIPLWTVSLPWPCSNEEYEARMRGVCDRAVGEGVEAVAFGDLFLADIRAYREKQLAGTGLQPLFPLWQLPTKQLASDMILAGMRAKVAVIDPKVASKGLLGRDFDTLFLNDLPPHVDPCGENGEFHTFVYNAPEFSAPIQIVTGEILERDGFVFADLAPHP